MHKLTSPLKLRRGDTMVEVLFALAVFALISVLSIIVMNAGVTTAEASLELSMARNEIDAQSEVLRFLHNSFLNEREMIRQDYEDIWNELKKYMNAPKTNAILPLNVDDCRERYADSGSSNIFSSRQVIILNTRKVDPTHPSDTIIKATRDKFRATELNPRLIFSSGSNDTDTTLHENYTNLKYVEGIWIIPVKSESGTDSNHPEFYDFHIYTCWNAPGRNRPTTIGTIMRLYNPELIEVGR